METQTEYVVKQDLEFVVKQEGKSFEDIIADKMLEKARKADEDSLRKKERYVNFSVEAIDKMWDCLNPTEIKVLQQLVTRINRDKGGFYDYEGSRERYVWGNLDKYYKQGYLATCVTKRWFGEKIGMGRTHVSNVIKRLKKLNVIQDLGWESVKIGKSYNRAEILALGKVIVTDYNIHEYLFIDFIDLPEKPPKKPRGKGWHSEDKEF